MACPIEGLVGRPSSLKKAAPLTRMNRDYSGSAVGMSQKMMASLYSQNLKANLPKCQD